MYINTLSWDRPTICNDDDDDDEDYAIIVTPSLSTEEPDNSLSMGDEHLDTISATKSDEFIKSSVENLVSIPSESEGNPDNMCDVPFHDNSLPLDVSKDQFEDFSDSNDDSTSNDDDSFSIDNIEYVEASPPDYEVVSLEVMEIVIPEVGGIDDDILLTIKDDILCEKLLNVNLLIAKIKALNDNPTPSFDFMTKSSFTSLNFLLKKTNTFDNSLPKFEIFCFDLEEISSGSTTTRSDISLPEYEAFYDDHVKEISSGSTTTHSDSSLYDSFIFDLSINPFPPDEPNSGDFTMDVVEDIFPTREQRVHDYNDLPTHPPFQLNLDFILSSESLFAYVVWIFLPFLSYSIAPQFLLSFGNEDTIFDPGYSQNLKTHAEGFCPSSLHFLSFINESSIPHQIQIHHHSNAPSSNSTYNHSSHKDLRCTVNHQNGGVVVAEISVVEDSQVREVSSPTTPGTKSTEKSQNLKRVFMQEVVILAVKFVVRKKQQEKKPQKKKPEASKVTEMVLKIHLHCEGCAKEVKYCILKMTYDLLREKLLNVNLLIAKIKALNANPTPSFDCKTKSPSTSLHSLLEETNTFDNSLHEFETFCFDVEEISSGSTTTHSDISLPEYEAFYDDHVKEISSGSPTTHSDSSLYASFIFDLSINQFPPADRSDFYEFTDELIPFISPTEYDCFLFKVKPNSRDFTKDVVEDISPTKEPQVLNALPTHPTLQLNMKFQPSSESLFTYVVWIFIPFLVYSVAPHYLLSLRNEDTIFDLGICNSHLSKPDVSHRCGTVKKFNTHRSHLNECPMLINEKNTPILDVPLFHFYPT
nr:agenet-like domain-containing protein [Tanacetum cinerariifolium]